MIIDAENTFFYKHDLTGGVTSNVLANGEGGCAYEGLWICAMVNKALSAEAALEVKTSDKEDMSDAVLLATLKVEKDEVKGANLRMPLGLKKYIRIEVTGATTGTITAFLTPDVNLQ